MVAAVPSDAGRLDAQSMRTLLQAIEACGHDPVRFVAGGCAQVRAWVHPRGSMTWEDFAQVVEAVATEGRPLLARVSRLVAELHPMPRVLTGFLLPPAQLFRAIASFTARVPWWDGQVRDVGRRALEIELVLPRDRQPSYDVFDFYGQMFSALPRALGFHRTGVEVTHLSPGGVRVFITPEPPRGLGRIVPEAHAQAVIAHLVGEPRRQLSPRERVAVPQVSDLQLHFNLTRAEARVVRRLAMGRSLKHIAKELDISPETARTHAKRAMQKTHTHRQAELVSVVLGGELG